MGVFFSFFCYLSVDPIKSCLFLVISLLVVSPFLSFGFQIWYSYFICMVFLRGIFVILVYFTSISKYNFFKFKFSLLIFIGFFFIPSLIFIKGLMIQEIFFFDYFFIFFWLVFRLFFFINFSSYFLNYSGALRKS